MVGSISTVKSAWNYDQCSSRKLEVPLGGLNGNGITHLRTFVLAEELPRLSSFQ